MGRYQGKSCPFCGGQVFGADRAGSCTTWFNCYQCQVYFRFDGNPETAIERWENRSLESETHKKHVAGVMERNRQLETWNGELEDKVKVLTEHPSKCVYIGPRSFWDWLEESKWPKPKRRVSLGILLTTICVIAGTCFALAAGWFDEFGAEWAKGPMCISCALLAFGCFFGVLASIIYACSSD